MRTLLDVVVHGQDVRVKAMLCEIIAIFSLYCPDDT